MAEEGEIPCTFRNCGLVFKSFGDMQHHKANADGHSYCMKCDLDFPTHQGLHLHKIMSDRHFACPECCLELRSEAGLDVHMRNNHREGRQVTCVGCGAKYKTASAVVKHIEDKQCPVLSLPDRTSNDINYNFRTDGVLTMGRASTGLQNSHSGGSSEDEDMDGGVALDPGSADVKGKRPSREADNATISSDDWPELVAPTTPWKRKSGSTSTDSPGGVLLNDLVDTPVGRASPFPLPSETNVPNSPQAGSSNCAGPSRHRISIHGDLQRVSPEHFWNAEKGRYYCNCGASFQFSATFEYHLTMEDETINDCPRCFKRFVSLAALVAHMEARWSKCAVRATTGQIEQELSDITQGLADIPRLYTESDLDAIDANMRSQPEQHSPGTLIIGPVSSVAEIISSHGRAAPYGGVGFAHTEVGSSSDTVHASLPTSFSDPGFAFLHAEMNHSHADAESSQAESMVGSVVDDLRGLVFSSPQYEDNEEEL